MQAANDSIWPTCGILRKGLFDGVEHGNHMLADWPQIIRAGAFIGECSACSLSDIDVAAARPCQSRSKLSLAPDVEGDDETDVFQGDQ
jgi:hypothetical protein